MSLYRRACSRCDASAVVALPYWTHRGRIVIPEQWRLVAGRLVCPDHRGLSDAGPRAMPAA